MSSDTKLRARSSVLNANWNVHLYGVHEKMPQLISSRTIFASAYSHEKNLFHSFDNRAQPTHIERRRSSQRKMLIWTRKKFFFLSVILLRNIFVLSGQELKFITVYYILILIQWNLDKAKGKRIEHLAGFRGLKWNPTESFLNEHLKDFPTKTASV